ncbi:MAG TPA: FAD-dependent oxidoreductase [Patescibacteria group bacterium]
MIKARTFTLPFIKKEYVGKDTYSFVFDLKGFSAIGELETSWNFEPGQYVRMSLPHDNADERGTSRYFTISSSPQNKENLVITVKLRDSSFKKTLHALQPGDLSHFFGPMGWFLLPKDENLEKVFIAGGIGITPFHSLLHFLANKTLPQQITLFASFRTKEDVLFYDSIQKVAKQNPKIKAIYTLTREFYADSDLFFEKGRISKELLQKYLKDIYAPAYYIVGPARMVEGARALLLDLGVTEEKIQTEDFTGY